MNVMNEVLKFNQRKALVFSKGKSVSGISKRMEKVINLKLVMVSSHLATEGNLTAEGNLSLYGYWHNVEILNKKCPQCGKKIVCVYIQDVYGEDLLESDYYIHVCSNPKCNFDRYHVIHSCLIKPNRRNTCWFCNRKISFVELKKN